MFEKDWLYRCNFDLLHMPDKISNAWLTTLNGDIVEKNIFLTAGGVALGFNW